MAETRPGPFSSAVWYNLFMAKFRFYCPIQVRYGDLDPQWHVNNARFCSYIEQARLAYWQELGIFDGASFFDLGLIVADLHIRYLAQINLGQTVRVGVQVARIGNKSMNFEYQIEDATTGQVLATAETVMVAYDYHRHESIRVSDDWRRRISEFEGVELDTSPK
jgi:acyl-CoA thioester hydrolase